MEGEVLAVAEVAEAGKDNHDLNFKLNLVHEFNLNGMYRKDLITAEIEKLAQVLAKIMGLKIELKLEEADALFKETLAKSFGLDSKLLTEPNTSEFEKWLSQSELNAEHLNSLSDFIFSQLDFENNIIPSQLMAQKLNFVYKKLVDDFQTVHLINMGRQKYIEQYI